VKRGEIWTVAGAPGYGNKPRPALIVQSNRLDAAQTVLTCGFTSEDNAELPFRPLIVATPENGLGKSSSVMAEKLTAVSRSKLGKRIGTLSDEHMEQVELALLLVLGFAG
jgi:mRNA interferase MazF